MTLSSKLPATLPTDRTAKTYAGSALKTYMLPLGATAIVTAALTNTAIVAQGATTMTLSAPAATFIPSGTVLTFGTTEVTTTADVTVDAGGDAVAIEAATAGITANATSDYSNLVEVPNTEDSNPSLSDSEETIRVHGRLTPIRSINGKDLTATIKTLAGIDDPVVKRLTLKGMQLSPNNMERIVWIYPDGFALLATVNIGAPQRDSAPGNTMRNNFSANLAGALAWADLNETTPVWREVNAE